MRNEHSEKWKLRKVFDLDVNGQVIRNPEGEYGPRIVACTWDAGKYVVDRHRDLLHAGSKKTYASLQQDVYGVRREDIEYLIKRCAICAHKNATNTKAPLRPIEVDRVMERIQIDLIDMRHIADGRFKWICHIKDHVSKFTALYATKSKQASEIADCLANYLMFCGEPEIAQLDNGKEFKSACLMMLKRFGVRIINGRPRRPQTQGLVEQANGVVKTKLGVYLREMAREQWAKALPAIARAINRQPHSSLPHGRTPYEVMFNRRIHMANQAPHQDRLELFKISDRVIDVYCDSALAESRT